VSQGLSLGHVRNGSPCDNRRVGYTVFNAGELDWQPHRENDPRLRVGLSDAMTKARANLYRYPPGAVGRRHADPIQEEVFVVLDGTLTIHMGEDGAVERHELEEGSVLVVQPGTPLQLSNRHDAELRLFIIGAPPERGEATFLEPVE
jgi:mannose-6-phosphate isomerase-like protein (cupin superfamily)